MEIIIATINNRTSTYDREGFYSATWNPNVKEEVYNNENFVVLGNIEGKTYREKQEAVRDKAINFQRVDVGGLSYGELSLIENYFERYGKRYGLLREFRENAIC